MEINKTNYDPLDPSSKRKGGFRACMFVYALAALDGIGSVANASFFTVYFKNVMHFTDAEASNTFSNFAGTNYLLTVVGGFVSDSYLSRYSTCLSFGVVQMAALVMITIQAYIDNLHPSVCGKPVCLSGGKALMFFVSLYMLALGAGGVRGSLQPLGADQFDRNDQKGAKSLGTYFNGYVLSVTLGAIVGVTIVVWVAFNKGWYLGFLIGTITSFIGFMVLASGKSFYIFQPRGASPFTRVAQVIVLAFRNRHLSLPESPDQLYEIDDKERDPSEEKVSHTFQFKSLDKAAILQDGMKPEPWKVCTVTQVEEVKILARMLPILASTIIMNTCLNQLNTYSVLQGIFMNTKLGSFNIPPSSIPIIPLLFMVVLIPTYEFLVIPFARKFTGHPSGVTQLQRAGVGLVLSAASMAIAGLVEVKRKNQFFNHPTEKPISLFWLSFQYSLIGIADMFTMAGLSEFFYKEAPSGMRSLSTSFNPISLSLGAFLSTIFVNIINAITKRITRSKQGWLLGFDLNHSNLNLFYWFLAIISCINFVNYLYWTSWYKYREENIDIKALNESSSVQEGQSNEK